MSKLNQIQIGMHFHEINHRKVVEKLAENNISAFLLAIDALGDDLFVPEAEVAVTKKPEAAIVKLEVSQPDCTWMQEVAQFLYRGMAVDAIKLVRTKTGAGLKEAKDLIDVLLRRNPDWNHIDLVDPMEHLYQRFIRIGLGHIDRLKFEAKTYRIVVMRHTLNCSGTSHPSCVSLLGVFDSMYQAEQAVDALPFEADLTYSYHGANV